jgi:hypothetical protein
MLHVSALSNPLLANVLALGSRGPLVVRLQTYLNTAKLGLPPLKADGQFGPGTQRAVQRFNAANGLSDDVVLVGNKTWKLLAAIVGLPKIQQDTTLSAGLKAIMLAPSNSAITVNAEMFLALFPVTFGSNASSKQQDAIKALLKLIAGDSNLTDLRWAAYMLATVRWETDRTYEPIAEGGCDDSHTPVCTPIIQNGIANPRSYGDPVPCPNLKLKPPKPCPANRPSHTYYGRGYVQLTHVGNYASIGPRIGMGDQLVHWPEKAMDDDTAYKVMSLGMREGIFTGHKLSDYINSKGIDYSEARKIINPGDKASYDPIEESAENFEAMLAASWV